MTTPHKPAGIDVCSGPSLTRAERLAQEAARFEAARRAPRPAAQAPAARTMEKPSLPQPAE